MESQRLRYEKISTEHFDTFYRIHSNEQVMYYAYLDKFETESEARASFEKVINSKSIVMYVVYEKESDVPIGIVEYVSDNHIADTVEIGYFLLPEFWHRGYGSEMARWMLSDYFTHTSNDRLWASCHCKNTTSEKLMIKLGFTKESVNKGARYKRGEYVDEIRYVMTRERWIKYRSNQ